MKYIGRFAPSPSGPLHFGSLVAALGSFLQARAHNGQWLMRIEDLDPPREVAGSDKIILEAIEAYGLYWDGSVIYQSQHLKNYHHQLQNLIEGALAYGCSCTRKQIQAAGGIYQETCRLKHHSDTTAVSIRFRSDKQHLSFTDKLLGQVKFVSNQLEHDFILKRKDGLFAYQLAVVVDDNEQKITEVVRGFDLLDSTPKQLNLQAALDFPHPDYLHLPLALNSDGKKLSKQSHASAVDCKNPQPTLLRALTFLGQNPGSKLNEANVDEIIDWAIRHWRLNNVPKTSSKLKR